MASIGEKRNFDSVWAKIAPGLEEANPFHSNLVIDEPTTFYVETTGNDLNPGTQERPFQTIQAAINYVSQFALANIVKIKVGLGNFGGYVVDGGHFTPRANCQLVIEGTLVSTGISGTGTISLADNTVLTDATKSWTTNEHVGKQVRWSSDGGATWLYYPISENTATTLTVPTNLGSGTWTYEILDYGTIIDTATSWLPTIYGAGDAPQASSGSTCMGFTGLWTGQITANQVLNRFFKVNAPANSNAASVRSNSYVSFIACHFDRTASSATLVNLIGGALLLASCYLSTGIASSSCLTVSGTHVPTYLSVGTSVLSSSSTTSTFGVSASSGIVSVTGIIKGFGTGINIGTSATSVNATVKSCTTGIAVSSGGRFNLSACKLSSNTTCLSVSDNGEAYIASTSTWSASTTGISVTTGGRCKVVSTLSMSTVTNELSVDGATATLATMRAASPKTHPTTANIYGSLAYE